MPQPENKLTSLQMLQKMSSRLGTGLSVGGNASFAVLKSKQTPADLTFEYACEETVRIAAIKATGKYPNEVRRASTALKRIIDIGIACEKRVEELTKANQLGVMHPYTNPNQQKTTTSGLKGAGPLAKNDPAVDTNPTQEAAAEVDPLDEAIADMSELLGEETETQAASAADPTDEEEETDDDGGGDSNEENEVTAQAQEAGAAKSYPVGPDGVPIDAPVSHDVDVSKAARKSKKAKDSNAARLLKAVQEGDEATIAEFKEKAKRPESTLHRSA